MSDAPATPAATGTPPSGWSLALRIALRDLKAGFSGFGIFLACLVLGVWAIAAVGSVSHSLTAALARDGRAILGGDMAFSLTQREATAQERAYLDTLGRVGAVATLRAMAIAPDGASALAEAKAVDAAYPAIGTLDTEPPAPAAQLLAKTDGSFGAVAETGLLARLNLGVGDHIRVGGANLVIRAVLTGEPDKVADGIGFAPRLLLSQDALRATGLIQPGSLVRWTYRLVLPDDTTDSGLARVEADAKTTFPEAGWSIRSRLNASPNFERNIERFSQFLALVGLTALIVGGVGVANAVAGFVGRKRTAIAIMKSIGAPGTRVVGVHLAEVMMVALGGVIIGLTLGAATPYLLAALVGDLLPIRFDPSVAPGQLALAALYGLLTAFVFAIGPLGRAHDVPVAALFRDAVDPSAQRPRARYLAAMAAGLLVLVAIALVSTAQIKVAAVFLAAAGGAFVLLRLIAHAMMAIARALPRPRRPLLRLALANIHRPAAVTPTLTLSLGLGTMLLVVVALTDTNISSQLARTLPEKAPNFFFLDIPGSDAPRFDAFLAAQAPGAKVERVPMMRGRIVAVGATRAEDVKAAENAAWVLEGDRGITYAAKPPDGSSVVAGQWWPEGYAGPPLVSFDAPIAEGLGAKIGDTVSVNVLGRVIEARIANLRKVEWRSLGINFVMVFSPNTFAGAPFTNLATVSLPPEEATPEREAALMRALAQDFPAVSSIRVKDALEAVSDVVRKLALAIRGASAVVILASVLVLAGALAAGHRARLYDAVILKTLGATRGRLLLAYALEYGFIAAVAAGIGLAAGTLAAWFVVTRVMGLAFAFDAAGAIGAAGGAVAVAVTLGLLGALRILGQPPARHLRQE